jgi:hypothetical protein
MLLRNRSIYAKKLVADLDFTRLLLRDIRRFAGCDWLLERFADFNGETYELSDLFRSERSLHAFE